MIACGCSRSITPCSCGPAKSVFISRTVAPSFEQAKIASTKPRWLRHMTATDSPSFDAALLQRPRQRVRAALELGEGQRSPSSSMQPDRVGALDRRGGDPGRRRCAPAAQRGADLRPASPAAIGLTTPASDQHPEVERQVDEAAELAEPDLARGRSRPSALIPSSAIAGEPYSVIGPCKRRGSRSAGRLEERHGDRGDALAAADRAEPLVRRRLDRDRRADRIAQARLDRLAMRADRRLARRSPSRRR